MKSDYIVMLQKSCAFTPCYLKGTGKATKVYLKDGGHEYISHSINKLLNDYFAINMRSLETTRILCGKIIGRKSLMPLYIMEEIMLLPIKTTKPFTKGDKCVGYINSKYIDEIDFNESIITLESGGTIKYLDNGGTLKKRLGDIEVLKRKFLKKLLNEFM